MMLKVRSASHDHHHHHHHGKHSMSTPPGATSLAALNDATCPIPEEEESILSEGFPADRIQVAVRVRPLPKTTSESCNGSSNFRAHLPRRSGSTGSHHKRSHSYDPHAQYSRQSCLIEEAGSLSNGSHSRNSHSGSVSMTPSACWAVVNKDTLVLKNSGGGGASSLLGRSKKTSKQFTVDHVFDESMDTRSIYKEMGRPIVQAALTGRHGTLFAYGQTGSGKTFTLQGATASSGQAPINTPKSEYRVVDLDEEQEEEGLIQLAMTDLFQAIGASSSRDFEVKVQYFEIYNEVVQDLIAATPPESSNRSNHQATTSSSSGRKPSTSLWNSRLNHQHQSSDNKSKWRHSKQQPLIEDPIPTVRLPTLKLLEDGNGTVHVNALEKVVTSAQECVRLLRKGNRARAMAATDANQHSSRSHAIFRVILKSRPKKQHSEEEYEPGITSVNSNGKMGHSTSSSTTSRWSVLNFVDLAGSENSGRALGLASSAASLSSTSSLGSVGSEGRSSHHYSKASLNRRQREGGKINQSLLSLSRVIYSLSLNENKRPTHIGFRDSKLTRILQPSLSGNAAMAVLCCVSVAKADISETKSTLKFATSAKRITLKPLVNEVLYTDGDASSALAAMAAANAEKDAAFSKLQNEMITIKQTLREFQERLQDTFQPGKSIAVGRLTSGSALSFLDSSMGSSEETPTFPPPSENENHNNNIHLYHHHKQLLNQPIHRHQEQPNHNEQQQQGQSPAWHSTPNSNQSLAVAHIPSQSPLSPPMLPRQQQRSDDQQFVRKDLQSTFEDIDEERNSISPPPPLAEVEISNDHYHSNEKHHRLAVSDRPELDEQRANYLEERIETTESLVERIYTELNITRHAMLESAVRNAELQEQIIQLQRQIAFHDEVEDSDSAVGNGEKAGLSLFSGWFILVCIVLYALGQRDFFISAIIFLWLSMQVAK